MAELKTGDKVLVRDGNNGFWKLDFFSHFYGKKAEYPFHCVANKWRMCIPFEGNELLVGTKFEPDEKEEQEEPKKQEPMFVFREEGYDFGDKIWVCGSNIMTGSGLVAKEPARVYPAILIAITANNLAKILLFESQIVMASKITKVRNQEEWKKLLSEQV